MFPRARACRQNNIIRRRERERDRVETRGGGTRGVITFPDPTPRSLPRYMQRCAESLCGTGLRATATFTPGVSARTLAFFFLRLAKDEKSFNAIVIRSGCLALSLPPLDIGAESCLAPCGYPPIYTYLLPKLKLRERDWRARGLRFDKVEWVARGAGVCVYIEHKSPRDLLNSPFTN